MHIFMCSSGFYCATVVGMLHFTLWRAAEYCPAELPVCNAANFRIEKENGGKTSRQIILNKQSALRWPWYGSVKRVGFSAGGLYRMKICILLCK